MMHRQIATIGATRLGYADHAIFTAFMDLKYEGGGSGQGIVAPCLDTPKRDNNDEFVGRVGTAEGMDFIIGVLKAVGVDTWEQLKGAVVWAIRENDSWGAKIIGIQGVSSAKRLEPFIFADAFAARQDAF
jgi:hypothetical protein